MEINGLSKRFDATQALTEVSLSLLQGEVHSLVGENGAGKSTLIKIMTGIYPADSGEMLFGGEPFAPRNSAEAQRQGIAAIYQEPSVFPDLSVAENIFIGHQDQGMVVDWQTMYREASSILAKLDIDIDPRLPAAGLTVAGQQAVEIAKAISLDVRVLIMDEPTAALSAHEVDRLFRQVRSLKASGSRGPLHHPSARGVVHDIRSHLGVPGRAAHLHPARGRGERRLSGQGDGGP